MMQSTDEVYQALKCEAMVEALKSSGVGVWYWNIVTGKVIFNDAWLDMLQYNPGELEPNLEEWERRIHPDDKVAVLKEVDDFIHEKTPVYQTEHRLLAKNGTYIWVRDTGRVLSANPDGSPIDAIGTHVNITKLKEAEAESREYLTQHELISLVATTLNYIEDFDDAVNDALRLIGEFVGVSRIYIFEDNPDDNTTSNTFEWCTEGIFPQITALQNIPYEIIPSWPVVLDKHGIIIASDINQELPADMIKILAPQDITAIVILPLEHQKGKRIGFIGFDHCHTVRYWKTSEIELLKSCAGFFSNTFKRRFSRKELEISKIQYQSLVENQSECIIRYNEKGIITFANRAFAHTLSFIPDDSIKALLDTAIHPADRQLTHETLARLAIDNTKSYFENRIKTPNGYEWFAWEGYLLQTGGRLEYEIQLVGRNITKQIKYLDQIEQARKKATEASKAKSMFIGKVSHELRTPLNSILGYATLLNKSELDLKSKNFIKSIYSSARHLKTLIDDLLDFTKIESNRMQVNLSSFRLRPMTGDLIKDIKVLIHEGVQLKLEIDPRLPECIVFDRLKLFQILNNLLSNALKFTHKGSVVLSIRATSPVTEPFDIEVRITDSGQGIPGDQLNTIFDPFEQISPDVPGTEKGTGLGLPIVKAYVELLKGTIHMESELGKGTIVTVLFQNISNGEPSSLPEIPIKRDPLEPVNRVSAEIIRPEQILLCLNSPELIEQLHEFIVIGFDGPKNLVRKTSDCFPHIQAALPQVLLFDLDDLTIEEINRIRMIRMNSGTDIRLIIGVSSFDSIDMYGDDFDLLIPKPVDANQLKAAMRDHFQARADTNNHQSASFLIEKIFTESGTNPALAGALERIYRVEFQVARSTRRITSITAFHDALFSVGKAYGFEPIHHVCTLISKSLEIFDIAQVERILAAFSQAAESTFLTPTNHSL